MASPWPQRADDARVEMVAILLRLEELYRQQEMAQEHKDMKEVARLRQEMFKRTERGREIMLAARRGEYTEVYREDK